MKKEEKILVTGGTGFVGSYLLRYLVDQGYTQIRGLRRPGSRMDLVAPVAGQVEWVEGDVLDIFSLDDALEGVSRVYHCAAVVSFDPRDTNKMMQVNIEGTANLINAALSAGIKKFIHTSSIATLGRTREGETLDESRVWQRGRFNTQYAISKFLAEQEAWRGMAEGLEVGIVNPSVILGSGRWEEGALRLFNYVWNQSPFYPVGGTGFVDVRDVARFMIRLMESPVSNERFIVSAENRSYRWVLEEIARNLDRRPPRIAVRPWMRGIAWRLATLLAKMQGKRPFLTREVAANASRTFYFDSSKAEQYFDFSYHPLKQSIAHSATRFREASREGVAPKPLPLI